MAKPPYAKRMYRIVVKHSFLFYLLILFSYQNIYAQGIERFYNFCPDPAIYASCNYTQYVDSNIIFAAGNTESPGITSLNMYLASYNYKLDLLHKKELYFPGKFNEAALTTNFGQQYNTTLIKKVSSDKYLLMGIDYDLSVNPNTAVFLPFFFFFNSNLDSLLFVKHIDSTQSRIPYSVVVDKQKNIIVAGIIMTDLVYTATDSQWSYDSAYSWVAKYDSNANLLWEKKMYGFMSYFVAADKVILSDDSLSYIIVGMNIDSNLSAFDHYIIDMDTSGQVIWQKTWPVPDVYNPDMDITALKDGGYAFINIYADSPVSGYYQHYAFNYGKLTATGDTVWTKRWRSDDLSSYGRRILEAENGDLLLSGEVDSVTGYPTIVRTDSNGKIKGLRQYLVIDTLAQQQGGENVYDISFTPTGQILLGGGIYSADIDTFLYKPGDSLSMLILTDTFGCVERGCQVADTIWQHVAVPRLVQAPNYLNIYPNPNTGSFTIYGTTGNGPVDISVVNILGQVIYHTTAIVQNDLLNTRIDMLSVPSGSYFIHITQDGKDITTRKVTKL